MAANLIDEIKVVEEKAAKSVQDARGNAMKKLNKTIADAETLVKEAKQSAARQFREKIQVAERTAEAKAKNIVAERETGARAFYTKHKEKVTGTGAWIAEEVMVRYGRG
jgi:vacuolar-type H+-ATPase subunit H